jgi:hypothetical protein
MSMGIGVGSHESQQFRKDSAAKKPTPALHSARFADVLIPRELAQFFV